MNDFDFRITDSAYAGGLSWSLSFGGVEKNFDSTEAERIYSTVKKCFEALSEIYSIRTNNN